MEFAHGKIVLALEGGYNLESLGKSSLACVQVLLEDKQIQGPPEAYPFESTWRVIQAVWLYIILSFNFLISQSETTFHKWAVVLMLLVDQNSSVSCGFRCARGYAHIGLHLQMNYRGS